MSTDPFAALADPTRRAMLCALAEREMAVGEVARRFGLRQPHASKHLAVLRSARLVHVRRAGRHRHYRARPEGIAPVSAWVTQLERLWGARLDRLDAVLQTLREEPTP